MRLAKVFQRLDFKFFFALSSLQQENLCVKKLEIDLSEKFSFLLSNLPWCN